MVVSILIFSGFGTVATQNEKQIKNNSLNSEDWKLEIKIEGGSFRYPITIKALNSSVPDGTLIITMHLRRFIFRMSTQVKIHKLNSFNGTIEDNFSPAFFFGPIIVHLKVAFLTEDGEIYNKKADVLGLAFLSILLFDLKPISIP
jgi:hypothetical protein